MKNEIKSSAKSTKSTKKSTACCGACSCEKELNAQIKKLTADNTKLQKQLEQAKAKADKAAKTAADKLAKEKAKSAKLKEALAAAKAKK